MKAFATTAILTVLLAVETASAAPQVPFSGWLDVRLVRDSIWGHCELAASVDEKGTGTQAIVCKSDEGKPLFEVKERLGLQDMARLRQLLRDARLFEGQYWGSDLRGLDFDFVTLEVHDASKAAVLIGIKNESFESGSRERLLTWLLGRIQAQERERLPK